MRIGKSKGKNSFDTRVVVCFFIIMLGFLSCILRIVVITSKNYSEVQAEQSSYRVDIGPLRGTIFDCNRIPITNSKIKKIAAVMPQSSSGIWLREAVAEDERDRVLELLSGTAPFVTELVNEVGADGIVTTDYYCNDSSNIAAEHIVGYVGSDGHGVSGLQQAYDWLLYSEKRASAVFKSNGIGELLKGEEIKIENDTSIVASGVVSTIDINLQLAAVEAAEKIKKGAVVVAEVKSGKIRAMVSKPSYNIEKVSDYLKLETSPLVNRCLSAYNVGSVFKLCVAATALEQGFSRQSFNCAGSELIADRKFSCHEKSGHGFVDLKKAISQSCNVYFYNLAAKIGGDSIYGMASSLGFGSRIKLCDGIYTNSGNLTDKALLSNSAELANLSIGQGRLLLPPVSILTLYCAIANDGCYRLPSIVEGIIEDGSFKGVQTVPETRAMSKENANILREYLKGVISDGTGKAAKPRKCTAAGKTATAQTGKYTNGIEVTHSWFCGFFPADNPQYAVSVFVEGGTGSAEVFANIADLIAEKKF